MLQVGDCYSTVGAHLLPNRPRTAWSSVNGSGPQLNSTSTPALPRQRELVELPDPELIRRCVAPISATYRLRNETTSYHTLDLGVGKSIRNLPQVRRVMHGINDRHLAIQQDVLETYVDRTVRPC